MIALIAVDPDAAQTAGVLLRVARSDEREVARRADHRVGFVGWALSRPRAGMGMNIRHDAELPFFAKIPKANVS